MKWEKFIDAIAKTRIIVEDITEKFSSTLEVESIEEETGERGVKAMVKGEKGAASVGMSAGPVKCRFQIEPDEDSAFEIWQKNGKRGVTLREPGNVTCEVDWDSLHKFGTAKAAGLACAAGATFGFLGWLGLTLAGKLILKQEEANNTTGVLEKNNQESM